jgi:uncharacterized membrane protein YfcA
MSGASVSGTLAVVSTANGTRPSMMSRITNNRASSRTPASGNCLLETSVYPDPADRRANSTKTFECSRRTGGPCYSAPGVDIVLFCLAAFAAAFVSGVAGFAFGLIVMPVWLHLVSPLQAAALIALYAMILQGFPMWKLRHAIRMRRLLPLVIGGLVGLPVGVELLRVTPAATMRVVIGFFLVAFSLYNLLKPTLRPVTGDRPLIDGGMGVVSGVVGGATGLAGLVPAIWATLRGWPKDEQRAVFQPAGVALFLGMLAILGGAGTYDVPTLRLFLIGLPGVILGLWLGLRVYGRLDDAAFRTIVLVVLLLSGVVLVAERLVRG